MWKTLRQIDRIGIVSEPPPVGDESLRVAHALQSRILDVLVVRFASGTSMPARAMAASSKFTR